MALALCDVTTPPVPAQLAADDAVDRLILALTQRNECAALNRAKLGCLMPGRSESRFYLCSRRYADNRSVFCISKILDA